MSLKDAIGKGYSAVFLIVRSVFWAVLWGGVLACAVIAVVWIVQAGQNKDVHHAGLWFFVPWVVAGLLVFCYMIADNWKDEVTQWNVVRGGGPIYQYGSTDWLLSDIRDELRKRNQDG